MLLRWAILAFLLQTSVLAGGGCYDPSPAFPPPSYDKSGKDFSDTFADIGAQLDKIVSQDEFRTTSFSVEITTSQVSLWTKHHTARVVNSSRPGASPVTGDSYFRIASITKTFTVLGILQQNAAGNLSLDDPVSKYLPDLSGPLPWTDITIRALASQLHGIPRDWELADLSAEGEDPTMFGLPPPNYPHLPPCNRDKKSSTPCSVSDLYYSLSYQHPIFAPNYQSSYSNTAFELLGLVLANVSSLPYEDYIQTRILDELDLSGTTFRTPSDEVAVLPLNNSFYWSIKQSVHEPTGGLYSTSSSLSKFLRYVLTHFNSPSALGKGINWLQPESYGFGLKNFYAMPWEIFRTDTILPHTHRPVTFFTKGGGLPGYISHIIIVPEYDLAFTILIGGNGLLLSDLLEVITVNTIRRAEEIAGQNLLKNYAGNYVFSSMVDHDHNLSPSSRSPPDRNNLDKQHPIISNRPTSLSSSTATDPTTSPLNSSLTLSFSPSTGLTLSSFISNSTDFLSVAMCRLYPPFCGPQPHRLQLIPTLLYVDEEKRRGEKWRAMMAPERRSGAREENESGKRTRRGGGDGDRDKKVWDEFCVTDVDLMRYDGRGINEVVFWRDGEDVEVEMTAFRVRLKRVGRG